MEVTVGNVGDSRAYWLPEPPAPAQQLTVDDSVAQELMTAGAAADSVKVNLAEDDEGYIVGSVQAGGDEAPQVEYLEYGTPAHVIYPKEEGGTLAFEMGGHMVFAKYVFHPGTRAYGIFTEVEEAVPEYEEQLQDLPEAVFG